MIKQHIFILLLSSTMYVAAPVFAMEDVELECTGIPAHFERTSRGLEITTDNNNWASYQAMSQRFKVNQGDKIHVAYEIDVASEGIMSFGVLNTAGNGWYGDENASGVYEDEVVLRAGSYSDSFVRTVPTSEVDACLVLRNYHLEREGQTTFTLKKLQMRREEESDSKSGGKNYIESKIERAEMATEDSSPKPSLNSRSPYWDNSYHFSEDELSALAGMIATRLVEEKQYLLAKDTPTKSGLPPLRAEEPVKNCLSWCSIL
jgi:hypothetical protein